MIIDCISDLHGERPELPGGDILVIAGDLLGRSNVPALLDFIEWVNELDYDKTIFIAGNHDLIFEDDATLASSLKNVPAKKWIYLCDSGCEYEGIKFWGSPWTNWFRGMNEHCMAFTKRREEDLAAKWAMMPEDTDVLITHSPPYGIFDKVGNKHVGSKSLRGAVFTGREKPSIHIFGHIHEHGGKIADCTLTKFINASLLDEDYILVNKPVRISYGKRMRSL